MLNLPIPKEMESRISQFSQQSFVGSSVIGNAKKTLCVYSADLHLWICKATHLFCNASSCSCASFLHLLWKNLPVFRVGKWAMFPRNACVACRALVGFESRVCDCLNHLINLDRQHWETSNLHDNSASSLQGVCFHSIKSSPQVWKLMSFNLGWFSVPEEPKLMVELSLGHVLMSSLTSERGLWFSCHWFLNYLLTIPVWELKNQVF